MPRRNCRTCLHFAFAGEEVPAHFEAGRWSHMARWQD